MTDFATNAPRAKRSPRVSIGSILSAAREQFGRNGLHGANIEDIAHRSGRTRQLIYHYFQSKGGLYNEVLRRARQEAIEHLRSLDYRGLGPKEAICALFRNNYDLFLKVPEWRYLMLDQNMHNCVNHDAAQRPAARDTPDGFFGVMKRGMAEGVFRADLDLDRIYALFYINIHGGTLIRDSVHAVSGVDIQTEKGTAEWREYVLEQFLTLICVPAPSSSPAP